MVPLSAWLRVRISTMFSFPCARCISAALRFAAAPSRAATSSSCTTKRNRTSSCGLRARHREKPCHQLGTGRNSTVAKIGCGVSFFGGFLGFFAVFSLIFLCFLLGARRACWGCSRLGGASSSARRAVFGLVPCERRKQYVAERPDSGVRARLTGRAAWAGFGDRRAEFEARSSS